ncbi:GNAT family N-acetyltransferase [Gottfriedia solisilvae]|uniref:N-acetyltransferase n=1 Tax=Gottfriedia solisilvae TaxID=1516104 RepID=A0A8J3AQC9_9BACI|nr:GNAT family N-acetyltransferase [Gottfriedia solisilvae]GGI18055.1 N-acetyltransferase [Gottfriedia solisilvae]
MDELLKVDILNSHSFKIVKCATEYVNIEEKDSINEENLVNELKTLINQSINTQVKRIGVFINKASNQYLSCSRMLIELGFDLYTSKVEVYRSLNDICGTCVDYEWHSIGDKLLSEVEFKVLWKRCMEGSLNRKSSLSIEEQLNSVKTLLGSNWYKSCIVIYEGCKPIGITIPHLEPGTKEEGRLFFFGLLPDERGKGRSAQLHYQALCILKQMGATFYKGSTHETNIKMQNVFYKNNCSIKSHTESYYKYF